MKIARIMLTAFGPFTDLTLDFSAQSKDFHVVYGPNEAGKSSALRALRHMLFGIPVRTPDSFLHPNPTLRIGARLIGRDGRAIEFLRRKGQGKTLRGPDDETLLDDEALAPFLGGVSQAVFEQMFAIGHDELVRGGREIVSGGGSVGQALFAAGAGLVRLQEVRERLAQEYEALFKSTGTRPVINQTIAALKEVRNSQKKAQLAARDFKSHHTALGVARQRLEAVRRELAQAKSRAGWFERLRQALPLMARRKEIDAELQNYAGVPELPEDFGERRREIENEGKIAETDLKRAQEAIRVLKLEIERLAVPDQVLQQAALIEALQRDLGSYRKALADRPGLAARKRALEQQAAEMLAETGLGGTSGGDRALVLPPAVAGDIKELGQIHERLVTRLVDARQRRRTLATQLENLAERRKGLEAPSDMTALNVAVQAAREAGPVEKQIARMQAAIDNRETVLRHAAGRLPLWSGALDELEALCCPSRETVDRFERRLGESAARLEKLETERNALQQDILQIQADLSTIELSRDVPTEADLTAARSLRDAGWRVVREKLAGETPAAGEIASFVDRFANAGSLADAFEKSIERADQVADRLRRETEQVGRKGLLEATRRQRAAQLEDLARSCGDAGREHAALSKAWESLWGSAGITPLSPPEMRTWLADLEGLRGKLADLRSEKTAAAALTSEKAALQSQLTAALTAAGHAGQAIGPLAAQVGAAVALVEAGEALRARIAALEDELEKGRREDRELAALIANIEAELEDWRSRWRRSVAMIGLDAEASPTAALVVMEAIRAARALLDEAGVLHKRIEGIDRDAERFQQQTADLTGALAPDLKDEAADRAALLLNARLTAARDAKSRLENLQRQLTAAGSQKRDAEKQAADAATRIRSFCREAQCEDPAALFAVEKRAASRRRLAGERDDLEKRLRDLSGGATVEAFIDEAAGVVPDSIEPTLEQLAEDIRALEAERSELDQTIGTEKAELKRMDGGALAAEQAQEAERLLAKLEADVETFARFRIASVILARTIEQYREKHQGPLLAAAGGLFARMTLEAFSGIRAEYDDRGNPVLVGIRPDSGRQVPVAGMSDGTADQLYLALRLASLEQYLESGEPLPFVVDDILARFDDRRALATLEVLAGLSAKTQVILFTHHRHLIELAQKKIDPSLLQLHTL